MKSGKRVLIGFSLAAVLGAAALIRMPGLVERPIWQDEAITLLEVAGHPSPSWPSQPTSAQRLKADLFAESATLGEITEGVHRTDIHPPGYYWALAIWRQWFGASIEAARAFSLVCSLGAVAALFLLLVRAGYHSPAIPTAVYALSASAVHYGYEARSYALASVLVMSGILLAYTGSEGDQRGKSTISAVLAGTILGLAFHVHYLTLFPAIAVLSWLLIIHWRESWERPIAACVGFLAVAALTLPALTSQVGARASQFAGFVGLGAELRALFVQNLLVVWAPTRAILPIAPAICVALVALVLWSAYVVWRTRPTQKRAFWLLMAGLLVAPSLGVATLDAIFDKHLHLPRYLAFAAPATSVFLAHGIAHLVRTRGRVGYFLLSALLLVFWIPNWASGEEKLLGYPRGDLGSWTDALDGLESVFVAVGAGFGVGDPAATVYELGSREDGDKIDVLVIQEGSDVEQSVPLLRSYSHVWVVKSSWGTTGAEEQRLVDRLSRSSEFLWTSSVGPARHFRRARSSQRPGYGLPPPEFEF